ncbi:MAG: alpha/beta fold hydrolase, partial [Caldilineaceae bacterium]|nr:alpha/beta fold hydrolase [Caldilineaceae bacterium]
SNPDGKLITITYARKLSFSLSPLADPILFFHGGPGGSVLAAQGSAGFDFSYLRTTRDIIVWDQRGSRYSSDLLCPEEVKQPDRVAQKAATADLQSFTTRDDSQKIVEIMQQYAVVDGGMGNCPAYFAEQGIDLAQYNTDNTVRDAIALMDYLGYPVYNLFGISYGTTVSLAIMTYYQTHPDAALPPIRSALLDGVAPLDLVTGYDAALVGPRNILRVFTDCEADAACGAAYPNSRQELIDLLASLESAPMTDADGLAVTLNDLILVMSSATSTQVDLARYLPRMASELAQGKTATYRAVVAKMRGEVAASPTAGPTHSTNPLDVLTQQAATLAEQLRTLAGDVGNLGETSRVLAEEIDKAETLPQLYVGLLERYLEDAGPEVRNGYATIVAQNFLGNPQLQSRDGLHMLSGIIDEPVAGELHSIVNLLSDADVTAVWAALLDEGDLARLQLVDDITNLIVRCNTNRPTISLTASMEILRTFDAPQLIGAKALGAIANQEVACELFNVGPLEATPSPTMTLNIVPTLVMNGGTDHATPVEWGEIAFATLDNARMLTVPLTDHGITRFSKCAKDIAHAFFLNPAMELVTSCISQFAPVYILPDDALPGSAAQ